MGRQSGWTRIASGGRWAVALAAVVGAFAPAPAAMAETAAAESPVPWQVPSEDAIRALLAERMADNGVGVVVGVVDPTGHHVVAHGRTGADDDRPLDGDTIFQIGSVTKVFTSLLLSQMALAGEVSVDDPAASYLPEGVPMPRKGEAITLADLATHFSGLPSMPNNFDLTATPDPYEAYSEADLFAFLSSYIPEIEPGERYVYSNLGVSLLGRLLAAHEGMRYEELLRERVLEPLGLDSTSITLSPDQEARLAPGFDRDLEPVHTWEMATLQGSGSLRSSVNDLLSFLDAYLGYRDTPLEEAMAYQLTEVRRQAGGTTQLLGWSERSFQGTTIIGHDGGKEGYRSAVVFNPAARVGVVVLSNARTDDTPIMLAVHLLTGRPLPPAPARPQHVRVAATPEALDACAGRYAFEDESVLEVARQGDHLLVTRPGDGIDRYFLTTDGVFSSITGDADLSCESDDGRAAALALREGSDESRAVRAD